MKPLALALAGLLVLTACGGGKEEPPAPSDAAAQPSAGTQPGETAPSLVSRSGEPIVLPTETGKPAPKPQVSAVKSLVGTWKGSNPVKDYWLFKADGSGTWVAQDQKLWTGTVIPAGKTDKGAEIFRLSWQGTDPGESYWQVEVMVKEGTMIFAGTQQEYKKAVKTAKPKKTP